MESFKRCKTFSCDIYQVVVKFLSLNDLKSMSCVSKSMLETARRELVSRTEIIVVANEIKHSFFLQLKKFSDIVYFTIYIETLDELHWFMENKFDLYSILFGQNFNQSIESLPQNLRELIFGDRFNQPITLPPNLEMLFFGIDFNQPIEVFPQSLKTLVFDWNFNQPIGPLPPNLQTLVFDACFDQPLGVLPPSLQALTISSEYMFLATLQCNYPNLKIVLI